MSRSSFLSTVAATALLSAPVAAQDVEYGSVAIIPFGSAIQSAQAQESALILARSVEEGVRESGRFMAVVERSVELDSAIQEELEKAEEGSTFGSAVRINTESQMNAKYLVHGYIERYEVTPRDGTQYYDARVDLRLRLVDVETGSVLVSEVVEITNGLLDTRAGGGDGLGGLLGRGLRSLAGSVDTSPQDAIGKVHDNASEHVRKAIEEHVSLLLVDYDVDAGEQVSELVLLRASDIEDGQELSVSFRARRRMGTGFRVEEVGKARITRMDDEYAYAEITEGRDGVTESINEDPFRVVVRPAGD